MKNNKIPKKEAKMMLKKQKENVGQSSKDQKHQVVPVRANFGKITTWCSFVSW